MKIKYHRRFEKQFKKLTDKNKKKVLEVIEIFIDNPHNKKLLNHNLKGGLFDKKAISINSDLRIIFEELNGYTLVIFLDLGTHNQVYG